MFRRYSLRHDGDRVVVAFRGGVPSRRQLWMGAIDALILAGHREFVLDFEQAVLARDADVEFAREAARHITDCGGRVAVVAPQDAVGQRLIKRGRSAPQAPVVDSAAAALDWLTGVRADSPPGGAPQATRRRLLRWPGRRHR